MDYQTKVVLDKVKKAHDEMLKRMESIKVSNTNSVTIDQLNSNNMTTKTKERKRRWAHNQLSFQR